MRRLFLLGPLALAAAVIALAAAPAVSGKAVIAGQPFELRYAWVVRGPDHFEPKKTNTYIVMTSEDISAELSKCATITCAIWDVMKAGVILQPEKDGGFWIRALHPKLAKEQQLSGRGWKSTVDDSAHIVGTLKWEPQGSPTVALDLSIDAPLLKSY